MSGSVWGNPSKVEAMKQNLARPETEAERKERLQREAEEKARGDAQALNARAQELCNKVEKVCENPASGEVSSNYLDTYQHQVSGLWTSAEIELAFTKWKACYTGKLESLGVHKMGPDEKWTGDRDGKVQANFIRWVESDHKRKINVHINWKSG